MQKLDRAVMMLFLAAAVGCSPELAGSTRGTIHGGAFVAQDALFTSDPVVTDQGTLIGIASFPGVCQALAVSCAPPGDGSVLTLQLLSSGGPVTGPGTFEVPTSLEQIAAASTSGNVVVGHWMSVTSSVPVDVTAGEVTISDAWPTRIVGTLDLAFGSERLAGYFSAASCGELSHPQCGR
jgi:hypothetical protein